MRINPVLKNETKLAVRSFKFTLMIFFYVAVLSAGALFIFNVNIEEAYFRGINLESTVYFYIGMAVIQAILLMFIVPSLTSTAICAEREKQTLEVLLSTKMSTLSIIIGKLLASISRVIILIICTMPIYSITFLIGGVDLGNIIELSLFFIVTTIFVGSIGVFISTCIKTSKAATAIAYGVVLFIFVGIVILGYISMFLTANGSTNAQNIRLPIFSYLSPTIGFVGLLINQFGNLDAFEFFRMGAGSDIFEKGAIISIIIQIILSIILILGAAYKLNPLNKGIRFKRKNNKYSSSQAVGYENK
ncbi:ABC transporter permease [Clostridium beijerinckii]|uniref:ABC-2 family transporter protein n=1 Tax=Clostridium beijerinckii TaxID=1520 RepID=A0A1S8SBH0_CLOBE|nr:ABC transporter permease subunit [Clostridium beijerinckii]NRY61869.1 ABC-type transport system involved in multi-copper enzyme maturation permease subunit [Clostridium beijerinckii]OOM62956.1 ABC-2 family transporter protein [Clostridium beijerinckii]UYZ36023.1 ABC transporter permease [Clostridium beijerinckii]